MKIALVAPLAESMPPYGATERIEADKKIEQANRSDPKGTEEVLDQIEANARGRDG